MDAVCVCSCVCVCYHLKNHPVLFFSYLDNNRCLFYFMSVTSFNFVRVRVCVRACLFNCVYVHRLLFMYTPECLCMSCVAFAIPCGSVCCVVRPSTLTSRCHLLFPIINSTFAVTTNYSLSCPMTPDPSFPLCLLHAKHRVKTKWPRLFVYFPSYCKWSHAFPQELPSIQHLACVLLSMLKWIWPIWASYIMVKETDKAI